MSCNALVNYIHYTAVIQLCSSNSMDSHHIDISINLQIKQIGPAQKRANNNRLCQCTINALDRLPGKIAISIKIWKFNEHSRSVPPFQHC